MPARSVCLVTLSMSEAGPRTLRRPQASTVPCHAYPKPPLATTLTPFALISTLKMKLCYMYTDKSFSVQFSSAQFSSAQFSSVQPTGKHLWTHFVRIQFSSVQFSHGVVQLCSWAFGLDFIGSHLLFSIIMFKVQFSSVQFSSVQYAYIQSSVRLMLVGVWLGLLWALFHFFDDRSDHHIQRSVQFTLGII